MLAELSFPRWPQGPSAHRLSWPRCPGKGQTAGHTPPYCGQMTSMKLASWSRWKPLCEARRWNAHPCPSTQRGVCVCVCVCVCVTGAGRSSSFQRNPLSHSLQALVMGETLTSVYLLSPCGTFSRVDCLMPHCDVWYCWCLVLWSKLPV